MARHGPVALSPLSILALGNQRVRQIVPTREGAAMFRSEQSLSALQYRAVLFLRLRILALIHKRVGLSLTTVERGGIVLHNRVQVHSECEIAEKQERTEHAEEVCFH